MDGFIGVVALFAIIGAGIFGRDYIARRAQQARQERLTTRHDNSLKDDGRGM